MVLQLWDNVLSHLEFLAVGLEKPPKLDRSEASTHHSHAIATTFQPLNCNHTGFNFCFIGPIVAVTVGLDLNHRRRLPRRSTTANQYSGRNRTTQVFRTHRR